MKTTELCIVKMKVWEAVERLVHSVLACPCPCGPFQPSLLPVQLCWCLFIDVVCLSDDGCLFDAVVLAVEVALRKRK